MNTRASLEAIRRLSRIPADQQPGDWAALASAVNQLDDFLCMGGEPPPEWAPAPWKPYAARAEPEQQEGGTEPLWGGELTA